ncbi:MAG TPA: AAA family ATPase [Candidatus Baltobacteraceae bacterium]|nr:AAA family ATPase [Candidatus Baltobacteraceae bacterium]
MRIHLLGTRLFELDGKPWRFVAPPRTIPLLGYLIMARGAVPREVAASALWPDASEEEGRANLRRHLHHLQRALPPRSEPWTLSGPDGISWNQGDAYVDAIAFEAAHEAGDRAGAVACYGGEFLQGYYDEWIVAHRERLCGAYVADLVELLAQARSARDFEAATAYAQRILEQDEWREDVVRALMSVRYACGDRAGALGTFDRFARRLREEMRLDPMAETLALRDTIVRNEAPASTERRSRPRSNASTPFVGRARELSHLHERWRALDRGEGGVAFVSGEAGIGKTRLAREFALRIEREGGRVFSGGTSEPEAASYESLAEALRGAVRHLIDAGVDALWLRVLASLVPELQPYLGETVRAERLGDEQERTRLFEAISYAVVALARRRPSAIVLEDLHWSSDATLQALEFLARRIGAAPVLLIVTYRDDAAGARVDELRRTLQRERRAAHLRLGRFNGEEVEQLLAALPPLAEQPDLAPTVYRISEGNPLFAMQILRDVAETGSVPHERAQLGNFIEARIRNLPNPARALAEHACVAGRRFSLDMLRDLTGWSEDALLTALYELIDRHIARASFEQSSYEYEFSHNLLQTAFYASVPERVKTRLHARIAELLERRAGEEAGPAEIALHWERAGDAARAAAAYERAAQRALDLYANDDAARFARRSLELGTDRSFHALRILVSADERLGSKEAWAVDAAALLEASRELGPKERFEALECAVRRCDMAADREGQRAFLEQMRASAHDDALMVRVLTAEGRMQMRCGEARAAIATLRQALELTERSGDPAALLQARIALAYALLHAGDLDDADAQLELAEDEMAEDAPAHDRLQLERTFGSAAMGREDGVRLERIALRQRELARQVGDVSSEAYAEMLLGYAAMYQRLDLERAFDHWTKAAATFERIGNRQSYAITLHDLAAVEIEFGRFEEAETLLSQAEAMSELCGWRTGLAYSALNRAQIRYQQQRYAEAADLAAHALERARSTDERRVWSSSLTVLGTVELAIGKVEQGLAHLREGVEFRRSVQAPWSLSDDLCVLIDGLLQAGDLPGAMEAGDELRRLYESDASGHMYPARMCWMLARLARAQGDEAGYLAYAGRAKASLEERCAALHDPSLREAFRRHPLWAEIEDATVAVLPDGSTDRETRTVRRSS